MWNKIITDDKSLRKIYRIKHVFYDKYRISLESKDKYISNGWEIEREYKNGTYLMKRLKNHFDLFEDRVWCLLYKMKFSSLNEDRKFTISYDERNPSLTQQIDVFAVDDETVLVVECKSTESPKTSSFKIDLEAFNGKITGIRNSIKKIYPDRKICFIWATNNYDLGEQDKSRLESFKIIHFSEKTINYFENLADHLGSASKYQLLGYLFPNQKIKNLESIVPAIQGSMGGHKYFSFMIKPSDLLKFSYVLHRNNANNEMMPTYQRLIKKSRLINIRKFINNKGYFPNSVIININGDIRFDVASQKNSSYTTAKIGLLHLPRTYRAAYIIDGQHRVYGYSDTIYAEKHTIPVIGFVDILQEEQVKMFMDINENQKSVPKILRNTLLKDLYLESKDENQVRIAQALMVADNLGELKKSPLYNRVLIGENKKTDKTSITLENLRIALLKNSDFFTKFTKKNIPEKLGSFDYGKTEKTVSKLTDFLIKAFTNIYEYNTEEWNKGKKEGFLATNNTIMALIYLLNDFINIMNIKATTTSPGAVFKKIEPFLLSTNQMFQDITPDIKQNLKSLYGAGGPNSTHKELGYQISLINNKYHPDWLQTYIDEYKQDNIEIAVEKLRACKQKLRVLIKEKLLFNTSIAEVVDARIFASIENALAIEKFKVEKEGRKFTGDYWGILSFELLDKIINHGSNWSVCFKPILGNIDPFENHKSRDLIKILNKFNEKIEINLSLSVNEMKWLEYIYKFLNDIV